MRKAEDALLVSRILVGLATHVLCADEIFTAERPAVLGRAQCGAEHVASLPGVPLCRIDAGRGGDRIRYDSPGAGDDVPRYV